jgi:hypothetical protein
MPGDKQQEEAMKSKHGIKCIEVIHYLIDGDDQYRWVKASDFGNAQTMSFRNAKACGLLHGPFESRAEALKHSDDTLHPGRKIVNMGTWRDSVN